MPDDRQHAIEFQRVLDAWEQLHRVAPSPLRLLADAQPPDANAEQAAAILRGIEEHGQHTAQFVANRCGSTESRKVLWWNRCQLADNDSEYAQSADQLAELRLVVDNALLQPAFVSAEERQYMVMAIEEARKCVPEDDRVHPMVGAVVVKDGVVLAKAFRGEMAPGDHAEFTVLESKLGREILSGATTTRPGRWRRRSTRSAGGLCPLRIAGRLAAGNRWEY